MANALPHSRRKLRRLQVGNWHGFSYLVFGQMTQNLKITFLKNKGIG
jgi:hypothetical protein